MKTATVRDLCNQFPRVAAWIALTVLVSLLPSLALAQLTGNQRMGAYAPSPGASAGGSLETAEDKQRELNKALAGHDYRKIGDKIQYMRDARLLRSVEADKTEPGGLLIVRHYNPGTMRDEWHAVKNYKGTAVSGRPLIILAMRVGTYNYHSETIELYDCGTILSPAEERELFAKAKGMNDAAQAAAQEKAAAAKTVAAERAKAAAEAAWKSDQAEAEKGDAYGLLRMGERYRDGDGVEKDSTKAEEYLTKAAKAGSPAAVRALADLQQAATNPPAKQ